LGDKALGRRMTGKQISAEQVKVMAVFTNEAHQWFDSSAVERKTEVPGGLGSVAQSVTIVHRKAGKQLTVDTGLCQLSTVNGQRDDGMARKPLTVDECSVNRQLKRGKRWETKEG